MPPISMLPKVTLRRQFLLNGVYRPFIGAVSRAAYLARKEFTLRNMTGKQVADRELDRAFTSSTELKDLLMEKAKWPEGHSHARECARRLSRDGAE